MNFWQWIIWFFSDKTTTTTTTKIPVVPPVETTTTTTQNSGGKMKRALTLSINDYQGTQNDLRGCNSDNKNWANLLSTQYGFSVTSLFDSDVTRANVKKHMLDLIIASKAGDSLVFTYSGHGTTVVNEGDDFEATGKDQALYLYDGTMIDDEIRGILNQLPSDVKCTIILDSCFSGSCSRAFLNTMNDMSYYSKPKYMPPKDDAEVLRLMGLPTVKAIAYPEEGMNHILLSGTDDNSYSYDASIGGQATGAFSYYAIQVLKSNPRITYADFYKKLSVLLPSSNYPQNPKLEGSTANKSSIMFE